MRTTRLVTALATTAAVAALAACGDATGGAGPSGSGAPDSSTSSTTPTRVPSTVPSPTLTRPRTPNATMSIPPPAKDPMGTPDNPRDYAAVFAKAWADHDSATLRRLGTDEAVRTASGTDLSTQPTLDGCEGAAGSTYCTFRAGTLTVTVRVANEKASRKLLHAVSEVKVVR